MIVLHILPLLFGLTAALAWGIADFFAAKASKANNPEAVAVWVSVLSTCTYVIIFIVNPGSHHWLKAGIFDAVGAGISLELGLYAYYRGLKTGPVSIVAPVSSAYPLVSTLAILAVFNGRLRLIDIIGIIITVSGVLIVSGIFNSKGSERRLTSGVLYGIATLFLWGIAYALLGQAVASIGWQKSVLIDTSSGMLALCLMFALTANHELKALLSSNYFKDKFIIGTAAVQLSGGIIFSVGLAHTHATAVITAISSCYPSITIYLALKHFNERKRLVLVVGSIITIIGVIVLAF